jgi:hypothetical protein
MPSDSTSGQKPSGYWQHKANAVAETLAAAKRLGNPTRMPSGDELRSLGLSSLEIAITKNFGGLPRFAEECGLQPRRLPNGFFDDIDTLCKALRLFAASQGSAGLMPTTDALKKAGEHSLVAAIAKHKGVEAVSAACSLPMSHNKKPAGFYDDFEAVAKGVCDFIAATGTWGIMPSPGELWDAGESGLAFAITSHGGFPKTAVRLGLPQRRKPIGHWTPETIESEVLLFVSEYGEPGIFPTGSLLRACERSDLENAFNDYPGGTRAIADRLGLQMLGGKPNGYWENTDNIVNEVRAFIRDHGEQGVMPTQELLVRHRRQDLVNALYRWAGGQTVFAAMLGLQTAERPKNYWKDFSNLKKELLEFNIAFGHPGQMPSVSWLKDNGHTAIQTAINNYHGGTFEVARRLGWSCTHAGLWPRSEIEIAIAHELQSVVDVEIDHPRIETSNGKYACDIVVPSLRLILEFDSWKWHHGVNNNGVNRFLLDQSKAENLRQAGWTVIRIRELPLLATHPHDVVVSGSKGTKALVDDVVRKMQVVCNLRADAAEAYLKASGLQRAENTRQYIAAVLAERRGETDMPTV